MCLHDVHPVAYLLRPALYTARRACVDVALADDIARGQTVADFRGQWERPLQTEILETVDGAAFLDLFMARIAALP